MLVEKEEDDGEGRLTDNDIGGVADFGGSGGSGMSTETDICDGKGNTIDSEIGEGDKDSDGMLTENGLARGCGAIQQ
jgi:hypothetical protein